MQLVKVGHRDNRLLGEVDGGPQIQVGMCEHAGYWKVGALTV
jgi:hypothetical protein